MPDKILSQDQLKQLDGNIRKMIADGFDENDVNAYAKDFKEKFGKTSGPIAPTAPVISQELPTFQQQQETLQQVQSKYDKAVQDDRSRTGKILSTIYNGLVGAGESLASGVVQLSTMFPSAPYLEALPKEVKRSVEMKGKETVRAAADVARTGYTTREEEKKIQGKFDISDIVTNGIGLDDLEGLAASSGRILGDIALAVPTMGASYFIQGINDAADDYDEAVKSAGIKENENARMLYSLAGGTINGLLEKFAIDKLTGDGPVFKSIQKKVLANVLKDTSPMVGKAAIDAIEESAKKQIKKLTSDIKANGLRAGYRALVEGGTEGLQAAAEDGAKFATNWAQGVDAFNEQEIKDNFFKNIVNSAAAGAVFGPVIGLGMDKTFGRNINTQVLDDIANAKTQDDLDKINQDLQETFDKNNFSDAERQMVMDNARRYAEVKQTLPSDTPADAQRIAIPKIEDRIKIDRDIEAKKAELETVDESVKPTIQQDIDMLQDRRSQLNDQIREAITGDKFQYVEENGKFYKQTPDGTREQISKTRYDLEQLKQEEDATKEGQGPIQEGGTAGGIGQRPGTQEGRTQEAPAKTDTRYRNISSETAVGIPSFLGMTVTYKLPNRKITGTLIQEGQTLSVEDENGDVVAELGNIDELSNMSPEEMNLTVIEPNVELTENGFSVDGKELFNENENPFDAVSVDQNGNVMNVVLTTAGGKRRKFRGRVAQKLADQIGVKEDQRLQQEFALPTPTAPKVITTQPTIAKITEDNLDQIDSIPGSTLQKKVLGNVKPVVKAIGAAVKNITGSPVSVNIHDQKSFTDAVIEAGGTQEDSVSRGFYMESDGSIHLNMDALDSDIMLHEGFHPILDILEKYNPEIIDDLFTELESIPEAADIIAQAKETYTGDVTQKKEAITDFVAGVADGRIVLNPSNFQKIKNFILNMLNKISIGQGGSQLMNVNNEQDLVKLAKFITEKFATGEEITLEALDLITGDRQYESGEGLDIQKDLPQETTGNGPQFSKATLDEARRNRKSVESLKGTKISRVVFYDITRVGKLAIKNILNGYTPDVDGKGGPFYSYMDSSIKNKAVLAFVSINQAIQSLQRQILYQDGVHAIAAQNPLTAHLGNKSTLAALFGQGTGIFQNAAKTKAQESEIVKTLVSEVDRISKMEKGEAKDAVVKILKTVDLKSIKTIDQFRDNILLGEGDSFGSRGAILGEILQNKQTKITASTRDSHKILHYKYGIPTIADIARGNNQEELSNAELGDVIKLVKPSTEPVIYTTSQEQFDRYSKKPTPEMKKAGIRIELLEEGGHESYPFVLAGENVALLENYVSAAQLFERFKSLKKSQTFFRVGRMKKYAEAGMIPQDVVPEATGPKFKKLTKSEKQKRTDTASEKLKQLFNRDNIPLSISEAKDIINEVIDWTTWYDGISDYVKSVFNEYSEDVLSLLPLSSMANNSAATVGLAINNVEKIYKGEKPSGVAEYYGYVTDFLKGKGIESDKMYNFFKALSGDKNAIAVDMHVWSIIMGKDPNKKQVNPKNKAEFDKAKEFVNIIANELGLAPREVQAALWAANILRTGGKPDSYEQYIEKQVREKGLKERIEGWREKGYKPFSEVRKAREAVRAEGKDPQFKRLAPNGKPSNLNEQQYNQVRTPEFKNWFGDWENDPANASKVVDENGEPRVVYHGTNENFDEFKKEKLGSKNWLADSAYMGFFFAGDRKTSEAYTGMNRLDMVGVSFGQYDDIINKYQPEIDKAKEDIRKVRERIISDVEEIKLKEKSKLLEMARKSLKDSGLSEDSVSKFMDDLIISLKSTFTISQETQDIIDKENEKSGNTQRLIDVNKKLYKEIEERWKEKTGANPRVIELFVNIKNPLVVNYEGSDATNLPDDIGSAISQSKDGVVFNNLADGAEVDDIFVAFEPNQIKSATGNKGTFSTEDNRIQFQKVPKTVTKKPSGVEVFVKEQFRFGLLGKEIVKFKDKMSGELSAEVKTAENLVKDTQKVIEKYASSVTRTDVSNFMTGKPTSTPLPTDLSEALTAMRAHVDRLTERLIQLGVIEDQETIDYYRSNKGEYLVRSYEAINYKDGFWDKLGKGGLNIDNVTKKLVNVDKSTVNAALNFLYKRAIAGNPSLTDKQAYEQAKNEANDILSDAETYVFGKNLTGSVNVSSLSQRKDISPEIRALMGEYTDPLYNYYASIFKLANLTSSRQYLNSLKEFGMGKFLFPKDNRPEDANTLAAPEGSEALSPLNGLYTFKPVADALVDAKKETSNLIWQSMGRIRKFKTVYNPATHVKNLIGNMGFVVSNGHWNYLPETYKYMRALITGKDNQEVRRMMDTLNRYGVLNNSIGVNELKTYFDRHADIDAFLSSIYDNGRKKSIVSKVANQAGKVGKAMEKAYAIEDDLFKVLAFVNESNRYAKATYNKKYADLSQDEKNVIDDEVAEIVKDTYPTFSRVPKFVKNLSKVAFVGNFLSFPAESIRVQYNSLKLALKEYNSGNPRLKNIAITRMLGFIAYNSISSSLVYYSYNLAGAGLTGLLGYFGNDDEEEKKKKSSIQKNLAPWNKDKDVYISQFKDGKLIYYDMGSLDSYGYQKMVWNEFWNNMNDEQGFYKSAAKAVAKGLDPWMEIDFVVKNMNSLLTNDNGRGGKIWNPEDTPEEIAKKKAMFVGKQFSPGAVGAMIRIADAYQTGESDKVKDELVSQVFARKYTVDLKKQFTNYMYVDGTPQMEVGFKNRLENAKKIYLDAKRQGLKGVELQERYQDAVNSYKSVLMTANEYYNAAADGGVNPSQMNGIIKRSRIGRPATRSIINGYFPESNSYYIRK